MRGCRISPSKVYLFAFVIVTGCGLGQLKPEGDTDRLAGDRDALRGDGEDGDAAPGDAYTFVQGRCERTLTPAPDGVCALTPGSEALLIRGDLILPDSILGAGELLIDDRGAITCVGCDCSYRPEAANATELNCAHGVISPGLINLHDHLTATEAGPVFHGTERYDHRHQWRLGLNGSDPLPVVSNTHPLADAWGEARQLLAGTTSLIGAGGNEGFLRNLDKANLLEGLNHAAAGAATFPLGDNDGTLAASGCDAYQIAHASDAMSHAAYLAHAAEGIGPEARNELVCIAGEAPLSEDLLFDTSAIVNGIGARSEDIALLAGEGAGLVWSPRSNTDLYGVTAAAPTYERLGVLIAVGTDGSATGSINLLRELRCAEQWSTDYWAGYFTEQQLVAMATDAAAELAGFGDLLGALAVGKVGDVSIWDARQHERYRAVLDAEVSDVTLVLRGGRALYGDAILVAGLSDPGDCEPLTVCGADKAVCALREIGTTLVSLEQDLPEAAYELFFCGTPRNEPTCVPARPESYDGSHTGIDRDGDGVLNEQDNCPSMFNPPSPLHGDLQSDVDLDGVGDLCDICPLDADSDTCEANDPRDRDGDTISNASDNCPDLPNELQADGDQDGIGDLCDSCATPNPGGSPCPATIYDLKSGAVAVGEPTVVAAAIVTAAGAEEFWITMDPTDPAYQGPEFSSIFVRNIGVQQPTPGSRVRVTGTVGDFYGRTELTDPVVDLLAEDVGIPVPTTVAAAAVVTGGSAALAFEGSLVGILSPEVTATTSPGIPGEDVAGEFLITDNLPVDDYLYLIDPLPPLGQGFTALRGILIFAFERNKLLPRRSQDVLDGPPRLVSLGPDPVYIYEGHSGSTSPPLLATLGIPMVNELLLPVTSGDPAALEILGGGATIPIDATSGEVLVFGHAIGGPYEVTASLLSAPMVSHVIVLDPTRDPIPAAVETGTSTVVVGAAIAVTVRLDIPAGDAGQDVDILVSTLSGGANAVGPAGVHVPAGLFAVTFDVVAEQVPGEVLVTAGIGADTAEATLSILSYPEVGLLLAEVMYNPLSDDANAEWVRLYNGTPQPIDLNDWSLGWGGTSYADGTMQLIGTIGAFDCLVIGGPDSTANNGNPVLDLAQDFSPDLPNAVMAAGDGLGLFAFKANSVTVDSVPADGVVWGSSNASGFVAPDGLPFADAHVAKGPAGESILRANLATWATHPTPASVDCPRIVE